MIDRFSSACPASSVPRQYAVLTWLPHLQRCTTVDVDYGLIVDGKAGPSLVKHVTDALDTFAAYCGVDIFILGPKLTPTVDGLNGDVEVIRDQRWRVAIYGDNESTDHAKTQVLIFIDKLVRTVHNSVFGPVMRLCGRSR